MWDKKHQMQTIIARRKAGGGPLETAPTPMKPEIVMEEPGKLDGRHLAAQDMLAAIHEGSAEKFMDGMKNFMDIHSSKNESEPMPEE